MLSVPGDVWVDDRHADALGRRGFAVPVPVAGSHTAAGRRSERGPLEQLRVGAAGTPRRWDRGTDDLEAGRLHAAILGRDDYPDTGPAESMLLIQAIHHGNDHRTQICSTLGALELPLPEIDGWDFWALQHGAT